MAGVTKQQVAAARQMTAIEFLRRYRADDLVKSSARGEFELKSHDSFKINGESSLWHWKSLLGLVIAICHRGWYALWYG